MDYGKLTKEQYDAMLEMIRSLKPRTGRKSYKLTNNMYKELLNEKTANVSGNPADK